MRAWARVLCGLFALAACQQDDIIDAPNVVLDRPLDAVVTCISEEDGALRPLAANQCEGALASTCDPSVPQVIGFIANSERNEIALFRRCDRNGLVDLDIAAPGYNFIPSGKVPSRLGLTSDGCRVIAANFGSCDLTAVDVPSVVAPRVRTGK